MKSEQCQTDCPVRKTSTIIDKKWVTLIVRDLISGPKHFAWLQRSLTGISPKVLTQRLKFLVSSQIITRKVYPTNPPTTEYGLTPLGKKLEPIINEMHKFGSGL